MFGYYHVSHFGYQILPYWILPNYHVWILYHILSYFTIFYHIDPPQNLGGEVVHRFYSVQPLVHGLVAIKCQKRITIKWSELLQKRQKQQFGIFHHPILQSTFVRLGSWGFPGTMGETHLIFQHDLYKKVLLFSCATFAYICYKLIV